MKSIYIYLSTEVYEIYESRSMHGVTHGDIMLATRSFVRIKSSAGLADKALGNAHGQAHSIDSLNLPQDFFWK